jgi:hypothetical protein
MKKLTLVKNIKEENIKVALNKIEKLTLEIEKPKNDIKEIKTPS